METLQEQEVDTSPPIRKLLEFAMQALQAKSQDERAKQKLIELHTMQQRLAAYVATFENPQL